MHEDHFRQHLVRGESTGRYTLDYTETQYSLHHLNSREWRQQAVNSCPSRIYLIVLSVYMVDRGWVFVGRKKRSGECPERAGGLQLGSLVNNV